MAAAEALLSTETERERARLARDSEEVGNVGVMPARSCCSIERRRSSDDVLAVYGETSGAGVELDGTTDDGKNERDYLPVPQNIF